MGASRPIFFNNWIATGAAVAFLAMTGGGGEQSGLRIDFNLTEIVQLRPTN